MKSRFGWLAVFASLLVAACSDGGVRSPDYGGQLIALDVVPVTANVAIGGTRQFQAIGTFTAPPSEGGQVQRDVTTGATWTVSNTQIASITADGGLATGLRVGSTTVTASFRELSDTAALTVGGVVLRQIVVNPAQANVPVGGTQDYCALGIYSDSPTPREILGTVDWSVLSTTTATVSPATGACTQATGRVEGVTTITASSVNEENDTISGNAQITVGNAVVQTLLRVVPPTATIAVGASTEFIACGTFSDGVNATTGPCANPPAGQLAGRPVDDGLINWTSGNNAIATAAVTGFATGVSPGTTPITATLKDGIGNPNGPRSASAQLTVTPSDAVCISPLLQSQGATVDTDTGALCLGTLLCNVSNPSFVIDDQASSYATMNLNVGLLGVVPGLGGAASVIANAPAGTTITPTGQPAGFVVGRPAANLLALELLLSQIEIATLLDGQVVETSAEDFILKLDLLGLLADENQVLASVVPTAPYDALRLSFGAGVASALARLDVFSACTVAAPPAAAP